MLLHMLIFEDKKQTKNKKTNKKYYRTLSYFLNNVGSHAKSQPLLSTNEKKHKMSVRTFLPRALQLFHSHLLDMRLVIANSALRTSLAIYHLISNARSWIIIFKYQYKVYMYAYIYMYKL